MQMAVLLVSLHDASQVCCVFFWPLRLRASLRAGLYKPLSSARHHSRCVEPLRWRRNGVPRLRRT
jgi:hypothetical protein